MQGQGVFVDDIKRHGMGYIHFVRSPYAHAHITSIDVSQAEQTPGVYGTLTGEEVASLTDPFFQIASVPGANIKDYALAVGKVRYVGEAIVAVVAETRELARDASELVEIEYEPIDADHRRAPRAGRRHADDPRGRRRQPDVGGRLRVGRPRRRVRRGGQGREDRRAALPPLQLDAARVRRRARRVQPRHRAVDDPYEQPVPRLRRDHDGAGDALRARQAPLRHAGHRRRLRQQDHHAPAARRLLPARPQARSAPCSGPNGAPTSTCRCRTATSAGSSRPRSRSRTTARCSASARRRSTTPAPGCATSRSAASSGRR